MWEDLLAMAIGSGIWAVLSCVLLAYLIKDSRKREKKYTQLIESLTERLKNIIDVKNIALEVKSSVEDVKELVQAEKMPLKTKSARIRIARRAANNE